MKRVIPILLIISLIFIAGCGKDKDIEPSDNITVITQTSEPVIEPVAEATAAPEDEPVPENPDEPVSEPVDEPVTEVIDEPVDEQPTAKPSEEPTTEATGEFAVFNNSAFIGDSVSLKLSYYVAAKRSADPSYMGNAQFLVSGSLSAYNALWEVSDESVHPTYMGEKQLIEDSLTKMTGLKTIYIMLGMNDIGFGLDNGISSMEELLDRIEEKNPGLNIYIQSMTPTTTTTTLEKRDPASIQQYNSMLKELCSRRGYTYLDIYSAVCDENGYLIRDYCSDPDDMGIHFTDEGCAIWINRLIQLLGN